MRLIDIEDVGLLKTVSCGGLSAKKLWKRINEQPTIDAVQVVRCGECKHWYSDADTGMACEFTNLWQPKDGFCNWGERREP